MPQDFNTGLLVLAVGMTTVFVILSLVVFSGRLLIRLVNRYSPEQISSKTAVSPLITNQQQELVSPSVMAAIVAAVEQVTGGKGKVESIEIDSK